MQSKINHPTHFQLDCLILAHNLSYFLFHIVFRQFFPRHIFRSTIKLRITNQGLNTFCLLKKTVSFRFLLFYHIQIILPIFISFSVAIIVT